MGQPLGIAGRVVRQDEYHDHQDEILAIGRRWQVSGCEFSGIVYAHQLRITVGQAIADLKLVAKFVSEGAITHGPGAG